MTRTREENARDLQQEDERPKLGPCCVCGGTDDVNAIILLDRKSPTPDKGWSCMVCGVVGGAIAVVCDDCVGRAVIQVCVGYPSEGKRIGLAEYPVEPFSHDVSKHDQDDGDDDPQRCTNPGGHSWVEGPPDRGDEGPIYCEFCGADGDA